MNETLNEISEWLQKGRAPKVKAAVTKALEEGIPASEILENGLLAGMDIIGQKFKNNEVFVPEVLVAARAMNRGVEILRPYLVEDGVETKGTVILGTVKGDMHDIGKNLVRMMMEGKGLEVIDIGVDVPTESFLDAAREHNAKLICCSALLTTTMGEMKNVVDAEGFRDERQGENHDRRRADYADLLRADRCRLLYAGRGKCSRSSTEVLRGNGISSVETKIEIIAKTAGAILPFFCAFR